MPLLGLIVLIAAKWGEVDRSIATIGPIDRCDARTKTRATNAIVASSSHHCRRRRLRSMRPNISYTRRDYTALASPSLSSHLFARAVYEH